MPGEELTLQQAADDLGVHYMTAYRYVRLGLLEATKIDGVWRVTSGALTAFRNSRDPAQPSRLRPAPWSDRLQSRLVAGDAAGAWGVIEAAMAAGADVSAIYLDVITPAMEAVGDQWESGRIDVGVEHRASGIASRLIGRLGPRCIRRGRTRGDVLIGSPAGERHALAASVVADLLRLERWGVSDLGADTPKESFVLAAESLDDLVAIALSVTQPEHLDSCALTCAHIRAAGVVAPIVLGGQAIRDDVHARALGADASATTPDRLVSFLDGR